MCIQHQNTGGWCLKIIEKNLLLAEGFEIKMIAKTWAKTKIFAKTMTKTKTFRENKLFANHPGP
jgi:hypothetical protein